MCRHLEVSSKGLQKFHKVLWFYSTNVRVPYHYVKMKQIGEKGLYPGCASGNQILSGLQVLLEGKSSMMLSMYIVDVLFNKVPWQLMHSWFVS